MRGSFGDAALGGKGKPDALAPLALGMPDWVKEQKNSRLKINKVSALLREQEYMGFFDLH